MTAVWYAFPLPRHTAILSPLNTSSSPEYTDMKQLLSPQRSLLLPEQGAKHPGFTATDGTRSPPKQLVVPGMVPGARPAYGQPACSAEARHCLTVICFSF